MNLFRKLTMDFRQYYVLEKSKYLLWDIWRLGFSSFLWSISESWKMDMAYKLKWRSWRILSRKLDHSQIYDVVQNISFAMNN